MIQSNVPFDINFSPFGMHNESSCFHSEFQKVFKIKLILLLIMTEYNIIIIPTTISDELTGEQIDYIKKEVHQKWRQQCLGTIAIESMYNVLFPSKDLVTMNKMKGIILYYCFYELIMAEHYVSEQIYNNNYPDDIITLKHKYIYKSDSYLIQNMLNQIDCSNLCPRIEQDLITLVNDIMKKRDNRHLFGIDHNVPFYLKESNKNRLNTIHKKYNPQTHDIIQSLHDQYIITKPYGNEGTSTAIVLLNNNDVYMGHIYIWPSKSTDSKSTDSGSLHVHSGVAYVQGIRTSVVNIFQRKMTNVSLKIFHGVVLWCHKYGFHTVQIIDPLPSMSYISHHKLGFVDSSCGVWGNVNETLQIYKHISSITYLEYTQPIWLYFNDIINTNEFNADLSIISKLTQLPIDLSRLYAECLIKHHLHLWRNPRLLTPNAARKWRTSLKI